MTWEFRPYEGYGPLSFGRTQAQAIALLGTPKAVINSYESLRPIMDVVGDGYLSEHFIEVMQRQSTMQFADSASNNQRPELVFSGDELVGFCLQHRDDRLLVHGVNIWGKQRAAIIKALAGHERVMLFDGADYYFESVGLRITAPRFWQEKGSIGLYSRQGFDEAMDLAGPYEYTPDEITGKER
ncbi:hypothetical protein [Ottowia sp.]|uniref:hypothetical protein n=1 Tax=Ottowia sp. TaxID=1898956 RepID=UPI003A8BB0AF